MKHEIIEENGNIYISIDDIKKAEKEQRKKQKAERSIFQKRSLNRGIAGKCCRKPFQASYRLKAEKNEFARRKH